VLSGLFREHIQPGRLLADWTRHVNCDWLWYCPHCLALVIVLEEKLERSLQQGWGATRRFAVRHADRPYAARVTCRDDGTYDVLLARATDVEHVAEAELAYGEAELIALIVHAFHAHYLEAPGHRLAGG
jgi:hypothetical protein